MDWNALWQNVVGNWLSDIGKFGALLILGVIAVYVKSRSPDVGTKILYGLGICALLLFIFGAFKFIDSLPPKVPQVTVDNVEANLRTWLDNFKLGTRKISIPDSYFAYEVTLKNGIPVVIARTKEFGNYISLQANLEVSSENRVLLQKMKNE